MPKQKSFILDSASPQFDNRPVDVETQLGSARENCGPLETISLDRRFRMLKHGPTRVIKQTLKGLFLGRRTGTITDAKFQFSLAKAVGSWLLNSNVSQSLPLLKDICDPDLDQELESILWTSWSLILASDCIMRPFQIDCSALLPGWKRARSPDR
jgi:hypothetical protein